MTLFPHASLVIGLVLALATAAAFNWSWVAQHAITSQLPRLELRRPIWSLKLLFAHRRWLIAFLVGVGGWFFYILALRLAPPPVQSVSPWPRPSPARLRRTPPRREWVSMASSGCLPSVRRTPRRMPSTARGSRLQRGSHCLGWGCFSSSARSRRCFPGRLGSRLTLMYAAAESGRRRLSAALPL